MRYCMHLTSNRPSIGIQQMLNKYQKRSFSSSYFKFLRQHEHSPLNISVLLTLPLQVLYLEHRAPRVLPLEQRGTNISLILPLMQSQLFGSNIILLSHCSYKQLKTPSHFCIQAKFPSSPNFNNQFLEPTLKFLF